MTGAESVPGAIFSQRWWLDAVAPGSWDEVVVQRDGELVARLPYVVRKRVGLTYLAMPPLTQTLGPWIRPHSGKYATRLSEEFSLMTQLADALPRFDHFAQNFHHSITNWLPFYWQGFSQTTRYTYVIESLDDPDAIWSGFKKNIRTDVRKAEKQVAVRDDLGLDTFLDLNAKVFERQGIERRYSPELVERIDAVCGKRDCRRILFAEDAQGRLHAAAYLIWDDEAAYYLMGGSDPDLRASGATSFLMWEAIKFAATVTRSFDFEGSMLRSVERFFRAFGATQKGYFHVTKVNHPLLKLARGLRSLVRAG